MICYPAKVFRFLALLFLCWPAACSRTPATRAKASSAPATVARSADDSAATITLTDAAEERLGLALALVEEKRVTRSRTYAGFAQLPQGAAISTLAPVAGRVVQFDGGVSAGEQVERGRKVCSLEPLLGSPELAQRSKLRTDLDLANSDAKAALELAGLRALAAKTRFDRAQQLLSGAAGSARARDDAAAELEEAKHEQQRAAQRQAELAGVRFDDDNAPIVLLSPISGILARVALSEGLIVPAGAELFTIQAESVLWIRVPVPNRELSQIRFGAEALASIPGGRPRSALPVDAPHGADPCAATRDIVFAIDNADRALAPGQRVDTLLELAGDEGGRCVPWSAVIFDVYGGAWVYVTTNPHEYRRQRLELQRVVDGTAVFARGPALGTSVVTQGAAELYGTEFGAGK